jgi:hypothetical protein
MSLFLVLAFIGGYSIGIFTVGIFTIRSYDKGYRDGQFLAEIRKEDTNGVV